MRRSLICLLLFIALPAAAQIYKYTDANGNAAFSNQPPDGVKAKVVELPPLNSVDTQKMATPVTPPQNPQPGLRRKRATKRWSWPIFRPTRRYAPTTAPSPLAYRSNQD